MKQLNIFNYGEKGQVKKTMTCDKTVVKKKRLNDNLRK